MRLMLSLLLVCLLICAFSSAASELELSEGVAVELPNYANRHAAFDGAICVDVDKKGISFLVCFSDKRLSDSAWDNGFKKYADMSPDERERVPPVPPETYIYVNAPYGWYYPATHKRLGEFDVYEVDKVLCRDDSPGLGQPAACYTAILAPISRGKRPLSFSVGAIIEQPPLPGNEIGATAKCRVEAIRAFIETLKIRTGNQGQ